jgi:predicted dinucleotide-binding enzyme
MRRTHHWKRTRTTSYTLAVSGTREVSVDLLTVHDFDAALPTEVVILAVPNHIIRPTLMQI